MSSEIKANVISESSSGSGVTIDGVSLKDSFVTQPLLPHFRVYGTTGNTAVADDAILPFGQQFSNIGSHWNLSDHYFLTPITGVYLMTLQYYQYHGDGVLVEYVAKYSDNDGSFSNPVIVGRLRADATDSASDHTYWFSGSIYLPANKRFYYINESGGSRTHYAMTAKHTQATGTLIG